MGMDSNSDWRKVFVTVGTTKFEKLVETVTQAPVLKVLHSRGCRQLVIQAGGTELVKSGENLGGIQDDGQDGELPQIQIYSYKDSLLDDIKSADLVIGHAGAGTTLEVLRAKKPLLVVINQDLMDNHQSELANKLSEEGYLYKCVPETLAKALESMKEVRLKELPKANPGAFSKFLDQTLIH